jgi:hypothetical protein
MWKVYCPLSFSATLKLFQKYKFTKKMNFGLLNEKGD